MKAKKTFSIILVTALVTCLVTNTVRDVWFTKAHGGADRKMQTVLDIIDNYSIYDADKTEMSDTAARAVLNCLDDEYTRYYSKEDYEKFAEEMNNSYFGIGVTVRADTDAGKVMVADVAEGQSAEAAGVECGDYILAVDGTRYFADEMNNLVAAIRGNSESDSESSVELILERGDKELTVTVKRKNVSVDTVSSKVIEGDVGYIRITQFTGKDKAVEGAKDTYECFVEHMESLQGQSIKSLIIDLRGNPGGDLDIVTKIADYLLPSGIITYTEDKNGEKEYFESDDSCVNLPMAVLVNGGSASASEVLSGALKDFGVAKLVGEKTFGKGVVQTVLPLYDGSAVVITSSKYYTPSGECIHEKGIEPDVPVSLNIDKSISKLSYEEDLQLQKAVEILK